MGGVWVVERLLEMWRGGIGGSAPLRGVRLGVVRMPTRGALDARGPMWSAAAGAETRVAVAAAAAVRRFVGDEGSLVYEDADRRLTMGLAARSDDEMVEVAGAELQCRPRFSAWGIYEHTKHTRFPRVVGCVDCSRWSQHTSTRGLLRLAG